MAKKTFLVDVERCSGCMLCTVACKDEHVGNGYSPWTGPQPETGHFWVGVKSIERGQLPRVRMTYLPVFCQHCGNAACIKVCPEGAIRRREDGLVWIDEQTCTGCGLCQQACPYDVIYMNQELGVAQKCTGCAHRVDEGALPRCVEICPHNAILFGTDAASLAEEGQALEVYHPEFEARPAVLWNGLPQPWIAGTVVDADADEVLANVTVAAVDLFEDGTATVMSDEFGDFWLRRVKSGRKYNVTFKREGYEDFNAIVTTDDDQDLGDIRLKPKR